MAKNEVKIRFEAETKDFTAQIEKANSSLKQLKSDLKLNEAQFQATGNKAEYLQNKHRLLETELEANRQKQEALNNKIEAAKRIYGEDSSEVQRLTTSLTYAQIQEQNFENALSQCDEELREQREAAERAQSPLGQLTSTIERQQTELQELRTEYANTALEQGRDSEAAQELQRRIDELNGELIENEEQLEAVTGATRDSGEEAEKAANGGWTVIKGIFTELATNVIQACFDKIKDVAKATVQLGMDFTSSLSNVQAISGATGEDFEDLEQKARELGGSTVFSAKEVSDGFGYMAMAGWKTKDMLGGIEGVLDLAAASGEELATTSDIVTDALTAFGMKAEESGHFADILATASASANTNVSMLGESFKYAAPVAGAMGYSAEDVSIALGLMANSGIKASSAGTALRTLLTNMANPSDKMAMAMTRLGVSLDDGEGNMYSFKQIMDQLREGFGKLLIPQDEFNQQMEQFNTALESGKIDQKTYDKGIEELIERAYGAEGALKAQNAALLAGKTGMSGLMAIINASEEDYQSLTEEIYDCEGAAKTMADIMRDNLGGDMKGLESAFDEFKLNIYDDLEEPMRNVAQYLTNTIIPQMTDAYNWITEHQGVLAVVAVAIGVVTSAMAMQAAVQAVKTAMDAAETSSLGALITMKLADAAASMAALAPYILIVAAIAAVIAIIVLCIKHWDDIKGAAKEAAKDISAKWTEIKTNIASTWNNIKTSTTNAANSVKNSVVNTFNSTKDSVISVWNGIKDTIGNAMEAAKEKVRSAIETIKGFFNFVFSWPKIPLPHFSISPSGWKVGDLLKGTIPKLGVEWYAKGGIFDAPTIIPTLAGLKGVGEAGPEAVTPISVLQEYVGEAVRTEMGNNSLNYDLLADKIAKASARLNISVEMDRREVARVVRSVQA